MIIITDTQIKYYLKEYKQAYQKEGD